MLIILHWDACLVANFRHVNTVSGMLLNRRIKCVSPLYCHILIYTRQFKKIVSKFNIYHTHTASTVYSVTWSTHTHEWNVKCRHHSSKKRYAYRQLCAATGESEIEREFENKHQTDLYEPSSIYFGRFGAKQMCAKSCCEIRANSVHACLTPLVIKRNWWQQPKSFEQKKGKIESGSIAAAAVDKNAVKFFFFSTLCVLFVEKSKSIAQNRSAFGTHNIFHLVCISNGLTSRIWPILHHVCICVRVFEFHRKSDDVKVISFVYFPECKHVQQYKHISTHAHFTCFGVAVYLLVKHLIACR